MFGFFKREKPPAPAPPASKGLFRSLREGLRRTRENLFGGLARLLPVGGKIDAATLDAIEEGLLLADVGVEATGHILSRLRQRHKEQRLVDAAALHQALREELLALLVPVSQPLQIPPGRNAPFVILMVGVNGAGKTTTLGKLASQLKASGLNVMMAAGDTFRAAAVEQLQKWGERCQVPVVAQAAGADAASVIYDALAAAQTRKMDVLLADTAGRLHTRDNLMEELKKIRRVLGKLDPTAPHEVLLVLDATAGQNALAQAREFQAAVRVTGIVLTKMDGTAKGGILFAIAQRLRIPVRYIGIGEQLDDLRVFNAAEFIDALLSDDD
ncbi:MAG TPA: signal recognition particle-docking protein FtsY [Gammaproteobacteria bacterium]|nr:signal recognition particle-docking protein FtsY [Gammaproteobacteria bacterium]